VCVGVCVWVSVCVCGVCVGVCVWGGGWGGGGGGGGFSTGNVFSRGGGVSPMLQPQPGGPGSHLLVLPFLRGDNPALMCQIVALTPPLLGLGFVDDVDRQSLLTTAFPSA